MPLLVCWWKHFAIHLFDMNKQSEMCSLLNDGKNCIVCERVCACVCVCSVLSCDATCLAPCCECSHWAVITHLSAVWNIHGQVSPSLCVSHMDSLLSPPTHLHPLRSSPRVTLFHLPFLLHPAHLSASGCTSCTATRHRGSSSKCHCPSPYWILIPWFSGRVSGDSSGFQRTCAYPISVLYFFVKVLTLKWKSVRKLCVLCLLRMSHPLHSLTDYCWATHRLQKPSCSLL